jgi:hypothetical protein
MAFLKEEELYDLTLAIPIPFDLCCDDGALGEIMCCLLSIIEL